MASYLLSILLLGSFFMMVLPSPVLRLSSRCEKTQVAILGAGVAGITAAQALTNDSINDFLIVEYNSEIGGRCRHAPFGKDAQGNPYIVELGANWIEGTMSPGGPTNPIWTLVERYKVKNYISNFSSVLTYDINGSVDYLDKFDAFEDAYSIVEQDAGNSMSENLQDRSFRAALNLAGWRPMGDPQAQAVEWYQLDYEYAQTPDVTSEEFTIANYNSTFYGFSEDNNFVFDQRGFNTFIHGQASEFLKPNDARLHLNTIVKNITWSDTGVNILNADGSCIDAAYAILTFSIGVLQSGDIHFSPALPAWKNTAIQTFEMGTYTKIFLQFPPSQTFWPQSTQFFLYASRTRGYYPVYQSLDHPSFIPGSGILFVTVVTPQSSTVDIQDDDTTKQQILATLRQMFGANNVPEPIAFMYPRWSRMPWAYGSYSNWPPGLTLQGHENLRANTGRLFYAGEATSAEFFGYLQGAFFEGRLVGEMIAGCLNGSKDGDGGDGSCGGERRYQELHGTTPREEFVLANGWTQTSFQSVGDVAGGG